MDSHRHTHRPLAAIALMTEDNWSNSLISADNRGKEEGGHSVKRSGFITTWVFSRKPRVCQCVCSRLCFSFTVSTTWRFSYFKREKLKNMYKNMFLTDTQLVCQLYTWMISPTEDVSAAHRRRTEGVCLPELCPCISCACPCDHQSNRNRNHV